MQVKDNLEGQRFERLVVVAYGGTVSGYQRTWVCLCDCGKTVKVRQGNLLSGNTKSCGCLGLQNNLKHGMAHTEEYRIWRKAKERSNGKGKAKYLDHDISMSEEFCNDFMAFYEHIGERPSEYHSLGRIDNFKGYERGNIRWETLTEQSRNKSKYKSNSSGSCGVSVRNRKNGYTYYVATAVINGERFSKEFSANLYGDEVALFLATEQRDQWMLINELCFGIKYAPTHGLSKEEYEQK